ncbi:pyridoxamine 5'-phosphate oxidase family protein [Natronosalvus rutilus]|uniref:Pyridoxamine 5'-phosphate oxidase family protein n=1 Tax=Natronosalvus rutilus TaxID=2953753 RepID=A0A9E7NET0_9EURY|nr:pyridoxamine 5'-phosphate oxidase family protein [Natronosalvus rutilus]UTF55563.1 pyridoxamine 5'-phosphate oxidase family protein [Natronosalvus rutilus]
MEVGNVPRVGMTVDELDTYGIERMDDEAIERFLSIRNVGILGLSTPGAPYLLPMSFGYDGGASLYFSFLVEGQSRKAELADRSDVCSFLVYNAETMFHWRSVFLEGTIRRLSEEESSDLSATQLPAWQPELIQTASEQGETGFYEFEIDERTGISHAHSTARVL